MEEEPPDPSVTPPETPERPKRTGGSNPKRHHVVPRFYLERFAIKNQVELVERDDLNRPPFPVSIDKALTGNYFYSADTDHGREPVGEEFLRDHVDGPGSEAFHRLFDKGRSLIAPGPRGQLSHFLAFQVVRGHLARETVIGGHEANGRVPASLTPPSEFQRVARLQGAEISDEEAAETAALAKSDRLKLEVSRPANLHMGTTFPMVPELVRFFYGRWWRIIEFDEPALITSDEPVALIGPDPEKVGSGVGLADASEIVFPIDPRRALVMIRPDQAADEMRMPGNRKQAEVINRHVAFSAHRFIVRTPGTDPLAGWTVPKRAPAVVVIKVGDGYMVGTITNASEEEHARRVKRALQKERANRDKRGPQGSRPKPRRP